LLSITIAILLGHVQVRPIISQLYTTALIGSIRQSIKELCLTWVDVPV